MHIGNAWESKMAATRRRKSKWDVPSSENDSSSSNANLSATDAAKERAAKLNAMLAAQGKLAKGTPPPFVGQPSPAPKVTATPSQALNNGNKNLNQDLITAEVEINDSPARNFLCRGTTQDEINRYSGAAVSTRGKFMTDQEKKEAEGTGVKPLYLCIQGLTQEKVDLAVKRITEIMNGAPVVDINSSQSSQPGMPQPPRMPVPAPMPTPALNQTLAIFDRQPLPPGMHYVQEKVFVGLDNALPEFIVKDKLQGPGGSYFQHICTQTGAKVQLRGRGSGFIEPTSGKEAFEALYIYISHSKVDGLAAAKKLVESLIETVHTEYKAFEQTRRSHYGYSPYMNVGNPPAQPPSGYQPPPYGYQHPPPHGNGYPQPVQPPPVPGYMYNHPPHAPLHQPVPPHAIPPRYGPPPPPVAGYPNQLPPNMGPPPPRGPEPYHGYPPGPHHQGAPPPGPPPVVPHQEGLKQHPPLAPHMRPPRETERQSQDQGPAASHQEQSQRGNGPPQSQDPPKRKFKEKIPFKASTQDYKTVEAGPKQQESSILNPSLGEGHRRSSAESMPPPPALAPSLKTRPKQSEFAAPLPPKDAMPPPITPVRSRVPGKREAATFSQPAPVATKKQKTEDSAAMKPSAIASLVAYGEEDSSDEEGSTSPEHKQVTPQKREEDKSRQGARLPFWAVRR